MLDLYWNWRIPSGSFSRDVLSVCPDNLTALCTSGLQWTDVGDVDRALSLMARGAAIDPLRRKGSAGEQEVFYTENTEAATA